MVEGAKKVLGVISNLKASQEEKYDLDCFGKTTNITDETISRAEKFLILTIQLQSGNIEYHTILLMS